MLDNSRRLTQSSYRQAVRGIVQSLTESATDAEAAELIGCCKQTVRNARDMVGDLRAVTLLKIAAAHGPRRLQPVMDLIGMKLEWDDANVPQIADRTKESVVLKAALALSVALEDDGQITPDEILANRATIENARDALDGLLASLAPRRSA